MVQIVSRTGMLGWVLWLGACSGAVRSHEDSADAGPFPPDAGAGDSGSGAFEAPDRLPITAGKATRAERSLPRVVLPERHRSALPEPGADSEGADGRALRPVRAPEPAAAQRDTLHGGLGAPQCSTLGVEITPDLTPTDQCTIPFTCDAGLRLEVKCDGENDGTFTSLCECYIDGKRVGLGGLFAGEAPGSCYAAVSQCLQLLRT
jgi:hypothetical protein